MTSSDEQPKTSEVLDHIAEIVALAALNKITCTEAAVRIAKISIQRLSEENAELKGIIAGLNDVREGRVKPLAQIHKELGERHD